MQLCGSIRLNCWRGIQADYSRLHENLAVLNAAYGDYRRQVSPWLAIICETHGGNTPVLMEARNAAAECLSSLAGGFITCMSDFDTALTLELEALSLVLNSGELDAKIREQLGFIAAERRKSTLVPPPAPSAGTQRPLGVPTGGDGTGDRPRPKRTSGWRFNVGFAIGGSALMTALILSQVLSRPEGRRSVAVTATPMTGAPTEPQAPMISQPPEPALKSPESVSKRAPEAKRVPEYRLVVPAAPQSYVATPMVRGLRAIPTLVAASGASRVPVSLANGTNLIPPRGPEGLGEIKISNYTGSDAAVKLKTSANITTVRFVYVRTSSDVTVSKIAPGEYVLQFATGLDWDPTSLAFRKDRAFAAFDKVLSFSEKEVGDGTVYSSHEITLHAVPNGNVGKRGISAEEFSDGDNAGGNRLPQR